MADLYAHSAPGLSSPAVDGTMIVPNDSNDLPHVTRAIYIGAAGRISAQLASGATIDLEAVPGGTVLPLRVRKILASGTTAGGLVGLW